MVKSFYEYINEDASGNSNVSGYADDIINVIRKVSITNEYEESRELEYKDDNSFDLIVQVKKETDPNFETDSHFSDLPWEEINFKDYGFAMDANTNINKGDNMIPEITFTFIINPDREPKLYDELKFKLIDIVTHELNHTNQVGWNREPFKVRPTSGKVRDSINGSFDYFQLVDEIESMIAGMYARSQAEEVPLDKIIDNYLTPFLKDNQLTQHEYDYIFKLWLRHALENYPDSQLSSSRPNVKKIIDSI